MSISSDSSYSSYSSSDSTIHNEFIKDGRLINDIDKVIQLPKPLELLQHDFFKEFLVKPSDFNESESVYFMCDK